MCGIFGVFGADPARLVESMALSRMGESLTHRGPDGGGIRTAGAFGMGMRRLSIIDLKTGDQPIANEDRSVWVVFNGEIYNYRELTAELLAKGHRFSTASDTETVVHLYEEYGEGCVTRMRGMFAFAIWDESRRVLLLARDRLGIKPLYYADTPRGFVFGSELKAVVQSPWIPRTVSRRGLVSYLRWGYVPDPLCMLDGVAKLPPGHTLTVQQGHAGVPRKYWQATEFFRDAHAPSSEEDGCEALWARVQDAVRSHLVSDVPVGAFLSGGVDSSAVLAVMAREAGAAVKTFSVGFREDGYDELPYAREVAKWFGTEHHELLVRPEDLGAVEELLSVFDEPFADASAIPTYLISRMARTHVKVVLSGDGGDELFAGYDRYLVDQRRRRLGLLGDLGLGASFRGLSRLLPEGAPGKNYLYNLSLPRMERYLDSVSLFPHRVIAELLDPAVAMTETIVEPGSRGTQGLDPLSRLQEFDMRTYLPGDILTKLDRMTMANSLEARVPLLDHPLVEFACGLPPRLRLNGGETKYLLKRVLKGRVPDEVLTRPKQGFAVPLGHWFSNEIPRFFREQLADARELPTVGVKIEAVRRLVRLYEAKHREDHCLRLWALVVLEWSLRRLAEHGT